MSASSRVAPEVTVVVVPRERFSLVRACIERIYAGTPEPFEMIVVDPASPPMVARTLKDWEASHANCRIIRAERFLYPYEARNLALDHIGTEWVAFVDNDVMVGPGWLTRLLEAARETGARAIHPLYLAEQEGQVRIHMTDGRLKPVERNGESRIRPVMGQVAQRVEQAAGLQRQPSDFLEFHSFLIRRDLLQELAPFEPLTLHDDMHFSLRLRERGERIIFEPRAVITYVAGPPFERYDLPYFRFRWNLAEGRRSVELMQQRWPLAEGVAEGKLGWARYHLSRASRWFSPVRRWRRWSGARRADIVRWIRRFVPGTA